MGMSLILTIGISTTISVSNQTDNVVLAVKTFDDNKELERRFKSEMEREIRNNGITQVNAFGDWKLAIEISEHESTYIVSPVYSINPKKLRINTKIDVYIYAAHTIIVNEEKDLPFISKMIVGGLIESMKQLNE
jgi:hypothetical protein